jgi:anaerobic ribonucleoside-triphosphate reductase
MDEPLICVVCGNEIEGECLQCNIDASLQPTETGEVVCSEECATIYQSKLPSGGRPIEHWSRITGYYQNVSGWNPGKVAELRERKRYSVSSI